MTDDDELQQLREQTDPGTRLDETHSEDDATLEDAIVTLLGAVEAGDVSKTLSVRDEPLAALIRALEETEEIETVGNALREELDHETDAPVDRSEVLRLAIRLGLENAAPEVLETARDASARHASDQF